MNIRRVDLNELLSGPQVAALHAEGEREVRYVEEIGYHLYGELRLGLRIKAADDLRSAHQYLGVLELYALAAEAAAAIEGVRLFEVQGERVHLFLPSPADDQTTVNRVLRFSAAFNDLVHAEVAKKAGTAFQGFAQAACHGRTVVLIHGDGAGRSVISLSPAANAPAKRLGQDNEGRVKVQSRHLTIPSESLRRAGYPVGSRDQWENVPLDPLPLQMATTRDRALLENMATRLVRDLRDRGNIGGFQFRTLDEAFYAAPAHVEPGQAVQVNGFFMRADLSGFSRQVGAAFADGPVAVTQLVQRFVGILNRADQFSSRLAAPNLLRIPWAGDCANMGVLPRFGHSYDDARESIPCDVPAEWHSHWKPNPNQRWLSDLLAKATWAVGCAGGDVDDGDDAPVMLVAVLSGPYS